MKSAFKKTINWNKYQSKISSERQNLYLDFLIDPSFQGVYILFAFSFENEKYNLPKVEIKNYNVMIDGKNVFDQSVKSVLEHMITLEKLKQEKMMITQVVGCWIMIISINTIK